MFGMTEMSLENERFIEELVAAGRFESRHDAINETVRLLRGEIQENGQPPTDSLTAAEWCKRFENWAASHRVLPHEADDSRMSIYSGRGK